MASTKPDASSDDAPPPAAKTVLEGTEEKPVATAPVTTAAPVKTDVAPKPDADKPKPTQSKGRWCYFHNPK